MRKRKYQIQNLKEGERLETESRNKIKNKKKKIYIGLNQLY